VLEGSAPHPESLALVILDREVKPTSIFSSAPPGSPMKARPTPLSPARSSTEARPLGVSFHSTTRHSRGMSSKNGFAGRPSKTSRSGPRRNAVPIIWRPWEENALASSKT